MRVAWSILIVAGCYAPVPATGIPCAANGDCPPPLVCDRARAAPTCEKSLSDAAPADGIDAPFDSPFQIDATVDAELGPCLVDDFNDGNATDWTIVDPTWTVLSNQGPDNSFAFVGSPANGDRIITHPGMRNVRRARFSLDLRIDDSATGDFGVYLVPPGWTDPNGPNQARLYVALYVFGGDSGPNDRIVRSIPPTLVEVGIHPVSVHAGTWHHIEVRYAEDGSIAVELDDVPYMSSPADSTLPGPLDLLIRFWSRGAIDNVRLDCLR